MLLLLLRITPLVALALILGVMSNKRQAYLLTVFIFFPFIDLRVTSVQFGGFTVFDAMTFAALPFLLDNFKYFRAVNNNYVKLSAGLLLILFVGAVASEFAVDSLLSLLSLASVFVYANVLLQELYQDEYALPALLKVFNLITIVSLVWLAVQVATGSNLTFYPELNHNVNDPSGGIRYVSFFHDPQKYAQFLAMSSFLFLIRSELIKPKKAYQYAFFFITVLALLLTGARSALFGLVVGFGIVLATQNIGAKLKIAVVALVGSLILYQNADSFIALQRLRDIDESYEWRTEIWRGAVEIWRAHPLLGIGVGNYQLYAMAHAPYQSILLDNDELIYLDQPENGYLKILTEFGLPGFILFILLFTIPLIKSLSFLWQKSTRSNLFILCASLISWIIAFNSLYSIIDKRMLILVATVICSMIYMTSTLNNQHKQDRL